MSDTSSPIILPKLKRVPKAKRFIAESDVVVAEAVNEVYTMTEAEVPNDEKEMRTRKPSAYNIMLGEFMKKISMEEAEKPKEDRIPGGDRMKMAQEMYREWKKTSVKA